MARVSWKFTTVTDNDLRYFYHKINPSFYVDVSSYRSKSINNWNTNSKYVLHQGKTTILLTTDDYCVDKKLGMFSKTRKPFFFRSKRKKKNVTSNFCVFV